VAQTRARALGALGCKDDGNLQIFLGNKEILV
jgi:hypothetical protein